MNIFLFELRRAWKSAAIWTAALLAFLTVMIEGVYPLFLESRGAVEAALEGFPPEFSAAFGMRMDDLFSLGGFYSFCFLYVCIMGAVMASAAGLDIFSREKRSKCADFLMTKPVSRRKQFLAKLLASLVPLAAANALYTTALTLLCASSGWDGPAGRAVLAASVLFFTQLVVLSLSALLAVLLRKVRSVAGAATAVGSGAFVLTALSNVLEDEAFRYVAVFRYFDVRLAFGEGRFEPPLAITAAALTALMLALSYAVYCRGEIRSV